MTSTLKRAHYLARPDNKQLPLLDNTNWVWLSMITNIMAEGHVVRPRDLKCVEIIGNQTVVDMGQPVLTLNKRKLGLRFLTAEAWWILSGRNDVESIRPYSKHIAQFSDDGETFFGAYGPKIMSQIDHVLRSIEADPDTRQAVINIWRECPPKSRDTPCTLSVQFLVRNGKLHCLNSMRSSDAWLGWPYDVFNFSMLSLALAAELRYRQKLMRVDQRDPRLKNLDVGNLTLTAGSQHLYMEPKENSNLPYGGGDVLDFMSAVDAQDAKAYKRLNVAEFNNFKEVVDHLGALKDFEFTPKEWMRELYVR